MEIKIYTQLRDMSGKGEEWLMDQFGNVRAVFIDGNLRCEVGYIGNSEKTKIAVAN